MATPTAPTKLEKLLIDEVSGVDDPANEAPGWAVMKERGESKASDDASSMLARVRKLIAGGKDDLDMDKAELTSILDERDASLIEKVAALVKPVEPVALEAAPDADKTSTDAPVVAKAEEAPVVAEAPAPVVAAEATPAALTTEDLNKSLAEALAPYAEVLEKVLDRVENIEDRFAGVARKSLTGQDGTDVPADATPTVKSAVQLALAGHRVELT